MPQQEWDAVMKRVKLRREELGLSYQDLATLTGMSKSTLQRYETGGIKNFPVGNLPKLAAALQISEAELTGWGAVANATDAPGADPLATQLFAAYGDAKDVFDQEDIDDIKLFMSMVAQRKRKKNGRV